MGLTERHLFENEDVPENYEWALEDAVFGTDVAMLKEKEPKTVKEMLVVGGHLIGKCPKCSKILTVQDHPIACGFCGQKVKWNG